MALAGLSGSVKIGANTVSELKNWKLDVNIDLKDSTAFGDAWKESITTIKSWTGSAEGMWDIQADTNGQQALQTALLNGTTVALKLYVNATNFYSGNAYVKKISPEQPNDDLIKVSFDFEGTGALAYA